MSVRDGDSLSAIAEVTVMWSYSSLKEKIWTVN